MTKTVNPDLISQLREHYKNNLSNKMGFSQTLSLSQICEQFGLEHDIQEFSYSAISGKRVWDTKETLPRSEIYKLYLKQIRSPNPSLEQDALNLYIHIIDANKDALNSPEQKYIRGGLKKTFNHDLNVAEVHSIFQRLHAYGLLDLLEESLSSNAVTPSLLPKDFGKRIENWKNLPKNRALLHPQTLEQHPESVEPEPVLEIASPTPIDIDAIIAEKQKFFDETPTEMLMSSFFERDGVDGKDIAPHTKPFIESLNPHSSSFIKNFLRSVSQTKMSDGMKRSASLLFALGLYDDFAKKGMISTADDSTKMRAQEEMGRLWRSAISNQDHASFIFESARRLNYLPDLYFMMNSQRSLTQPEHVEKIENWCASKGIDLVQTLVDYELPPLPEAAKMEPADPRDALIAQTQQWFDETPTDELQATLAYSINPALFDKGNSNRFGEDFGQALKHVHSNHMPDEFMTGFYRHVERMEKPFEEKSVLILSRLMFMSIQNSEEQEETPQIKAHLGVRIVSTKKSHNEIRNRARDAAQRIATDAFSNLNSRKIVLNATISDKNKRNYFFDQTHRYGLLPHLYFLANVEDTNFPPKTTQHLQDWCASKGIDLKQTLADFKIPILPEDDLEAEAAPEITNGVTIIEVDGKLVDVGRATEMLAVDRMNDEDEPVSERRRVPHVEWLLEDIPSLMNLDGPITLYRSKHERAKGEDKDFSLQVIEFKTTDGRKHQIATNNWYAGGTYVIKPTVDINPNDPKLVHIPDLLGSGKAWPIRCANRDQYVLSTLEHCEKQLGELTPYIPRLSWADKARAVTQTCINILRETGERIKTNDRAPLQTGPLRGVSTPARIAGAINNGAIANLGADDLVDFYNKLFEKTPELKEHLRKPTIKASAIFNDCVSFIREYDLVPQNGFLDAIELAGFKAEQASLFFAQTAKGSVVGWRELLPDHREIPPNLDEFMLATGLAVKSGKGELLPNYDHPDLADMGRKLAHG